MLRKALAVIAISGSLAWASAAGAVTLVEGTTVPLTANTLYFFDSGEMAGGLTDTHEFGFTYSPPPLLEATASITINTLAGFDFGMDEFTWQWIAPDTTTLIASGSGEVTDAVLQLLAQTGDYILRISFVTSSGGGQYDITLGTSVVPLPPALLLFGTGLAGLAVLTRRRRASKVSIGVAATA